MAGYNKESGVIMLRIEMSIDNPHIYVCPECHTQISSEMLDRNVPVQHIQAPEQLYRDVWEYYIVCPECGERLSLGTGTAPFWDCVAMSLARMKGGI